MTMPTLERQDRVTVDEETGYQRRQHTLRDGNAERRQVLTKFSQLVGLLFSVLEILIGLRVVLKLIASDPNNQFANFIYSVTSPFLQPFFGLTATPAAEGFVLEVPSLIAMAAYALLGWLVIKLIWLIFYQPSATIVSTYEKRKVE
jgi:YggT family protein